MPILWKSKEVMAWVTGATKYRNWYTVVDIYNNVIFVIKLLIAKKIFEEILDYSLRDNNENIYIDLFPKGIIALAKGFFLRNYIY